MRWWTAIRDVRNAPFSSGAPVLKLVVLGRCGVRRHVFRNGEFRATTRLSGADGPFLIHVVSWR